MTNYYSMQEIINDLYEYRRIIFIVVVSMSVLVVSTIYIIWSKLIQKQLRFIQNSTFFTTTSTWYRNSKSSATTTGTNLPPQDPFRMIRSTVTPTTTINSNNKSIPPKNIQMLSLNPDFITYCQTLNEISNNVVVDSSSLTASSSSSPPLWNVMSLGEYISSLRPYFSAMSTGTTSKNETNTSIIPHWLEGEIQAALAVTLFNIIGPQLGMAILPTLGLNLMQTTIRKIVSMVSSYIPNLDTTTGGGNNNENDEIKSKTNDTDNDKNIWSDAMNDEIGSNDYGSISLSISTLSTGAEIHYQQYQRKQQRQNNKKSSNILNNHSPLDLLRRGEVGYPLSFGEINGTPSNSDVTVESVPFKRTCKTSTTTSTTTNTIDGLPNPFIMSEHWYSTIERMEERMRQRNDDNNNISQYDPYSFRMEPPPKVIDERFFPDLYIGYGDHVSCTHNQRQILYNRLLSTVLNRLAYNVHIHVTTGNSTTGTNNNNQKKKKNDNDTPSDKYFIVQISTTNTQDITRPWDLIHALIGHGHNVVTCIQTQPTTFGMALCVKEEKQWTNIPFGYFLQTGLSDPNGNEAYVCLPHSGLSLEISSGPIIHDATINIQHYMAIEGLCGWHSNHCANVPWIRSITCPNTTKHNLDVLTSVRIATWQAIVTNTVGTKYDLPHGGYGLTGVCNDSAAQMECAISYNGTTTHIYPLSFQGKFAMYTLRIANTIRQTLSNRNDIKGLSRRDDDNDDDDIDMDIQCIDRLMKAILSLPSDTNTAPISDMIHQCERYLHCVNGGGTPPASSNNNDNNGNDAINSNINDCFAATIPPPAFQLLVESCHIVESIKQEILNIQQQ